MRYAKPTSTDKDSEISSLANAYLAAIVESSDDAIISKSIEDSRITSWNAAAERMFGYTAREAIGQPITLIIPPDRLDEEGDIMRRLRRGEKIDHYETARRRKDGSLVELSITISPIRDKAGRIIGASKVARDISERRMFEKELRNRTQALAERDQRKNEFLAILAHELRNPLAPIRNAAYILKSPTASVQIRTEISNVIESQIRHITRLLDDLLDASRITHGKIEIRRNPIDLNSVIHSAVETVMPLIEERRQRLSVQMPPAPISLSGDATRLTQVFANLLNNAGKYSDEDSDITLEAKVENDQAVIRIRDNGIGIPSDMLSNIFDMFQQVDSSVGRKHGGLGIGLTLVKNIVEMHDGTIKAASGGLGKGSEFTVRLPLLPAEEKIPEKNAEPGLAVGTQSLRILVVDDNEAAAKTLGLMLESMGHRVLLAKDGPRALAIARQFQPGVVFLDIGLPGMNGYEVCGAMRQEKAMEGAVIIAQTGWGQEEHLRHSKEVGFDYHLVKPISIQSLQDVLAKAGARKTG